MYNVFFCQLCFNNVFLILSDHKMAKKRHCFIKCKSQHVVKGAAKNKRDFGGACVVLYVLHLYLYVLHLLMCVMLFLY